MNNEKVIGRNIPRFYKEPTAEDIESNGWALANINARIRARIVGSRVMSATVVLGIGTAMTAQDFLSDGDVKPVDLALNYLIPTIINGVAEFKIERQLSHTGQEITKLMNALSDKDHT